MTREAWVLRRNGRMLLGTVITVEPSLLAQAGLPAERDADGQTWYRVSSR